eukprot:721805_1
MMFEKHDICLCCERHAYYTLWNTNERYKDWFIEARELSLKQEMMHLREYNPGEECEVKKKKKNTIKVNGMIAMSMDQWNDIEERSHHIHRTLKCREMACDTG